MDATSSSGIGWQPSPFSGQVLGDATLGEAGAELLAEFFAEFFEDGLPLGPEVNVVAEGGAEEGLLVGVAAALAEKLQRFLFPCAAVAREEGGDEGEHAGIERVVEMGDAASLGLAVDVPSVSRMFGLACVMQPMRFHDFRTVPVTLPGREVMTGAGRSCDASSQEVPAAPRR